MKVVSALAVGLLAAGGSQAQPPSAPTDLQGVTVTARRPTHLSPVTVTATNWCPEPNPARYPAERAPEVRDSYPAQGGVVAPGYVQVRVTFDAPMSCYSEVMVDGPGDPCEAAGTWVLPDRRSWKMQCRLEPATEYRIVFKRRDGRGFVGLSGREAAAYELVFETSNAPPTPTREAAARLDPGLLGAGSTSAYVTCADEKNGDIRHDCSHERFGTHDPPN